MRIVFQILFLTLMTASVEAVVGLSDAPKNSNLTVTEPIVPITVLDQGPIVQEPIDLSRWFIDFEIKPITLDNPFEFECGVLPGFQFGDVVSHLSPVRCFSEDKRSTSMFSKRSTDKDLLTKDLNICNECFKKSDFTQLNQDFEDFRAKNISALKSSENAVVQNIYNTAVGSLLANSFLLVSDTKDQDGNIDVNFVNAYTTLNNESSRSLTDNSVQGVLGKGLNLEVLNNKKVEMAPGQCIPPTIYMTLNQFQDPNYETFFKKVDDDFKEKDWNFDELRKEYDSLALRHQDSERKRFLKGKLLFLKRNPLIRFALEATPDDLKEVKSFNKADILASIRGLKNCDNNDCLKIFKGKMDAFFHKDPKLPDVIKKLALKDMQKEKNRLLNPSKSITQRSIINDITRLQISSNDPKSKYPSPDSCRGDQLYTTSCVKSFVAYCEILDTRKAEIQNLPDKDIYPKDDLDNSFEDLFNPDFATNEEFQDYNKKHCNRINPKTKEVKSFDDFASTYCQQNNKPGCKLETASDYQQIFAQFGLAYPDAKWGEGRQNRQEAIATARESRGLITANAEAFTASNALDFGKIGSTANYDSEKAIRKSNRSRGFVMDDESYSSNPVTSDKILDSTVSGTTAKVTPKDDTQVAAAAIPDYTYQSNSVSSQTPTTAQVTEPKTIEKTTTQERTELLNDLTSDLNEVRARSNAGQKDPEIASREAALQQQIDALKTLLDGQKKLSQQQTKMLNDTLAEKEREAAEEEAQEESRNAIVRQAPVVPQAQSFFQSQQSAQAPVAAVSRSTGGSMGQVSGATLGSNAMKASLSSGNGGGSAGRQVDPNSAKYNLTGSSNTAAGGLTIVSDNSGNGNQTSSSPSIVLNVNENQYRNPEQINLAEIQNNLPKEQLEKLKNNSEIILVLRNGSNPPIEVKLAKKDNKLVKVENVATRSPASERVNTLDSLRSTLK